MSSPSECKPAKSKKSKSSKEGRRPKSVHHSKSKHKHKKCKAKQLSPAPGAKLDDQIESSTLKREEWMALPISRPPDDPVETDAPAISTVSGRMGESKSLYSNSALSHTNIVYQVT